MYLNVTEDVPLFIFQILMTPSPYLKFKNKLQVEVDACRWRWMYAGGGACMQVKLYILFPVSSCKFIMYIKIKSCSVFKSKENYFIWANIITCCQRDIIYQV